VIHTIIRTHRGGPETIVHTAPADLPPLEPDTWREPSHLRAGRSVVNPWSVRLLAVAVLLIVAVTLGVLAW